MEKKQFNLKQLHSQKFKYKSYHCMFPRKQLQPSMNFSLVIIVDGSEDSENGSARELSSSFKICMEVSKTFPYEKQTKSLIKTKNRNKGKSKN